MKYIYLFLPVLIMTTSCMSYRYTTEFCPNKIERPVGNLTPQMDQGQYMNSLDDYYYESFYLPPSEDHRIIKHEFSKYIEENISEYKSNNKGYALLRINHLKVENQCGVLTTLSTFSLGIPQVFGIPYMCLSSEMDLSLKIMDQERKVIKIYNSKSRQFANVAYYYGYSSSNAREKVLYEGIEDCFDQFTSQITKDMKEIKKILRE